MLMKTPAISFHVFFFHKIIDACITKFRSPLQKRGEHEPQGLATVLEPTQNIFAVFRKHQKQLSMSIESRLHVISRLWLEILSRSRNFESTSGLSLEIPCSLLKNKLLRV